MRSRLGSNALAKEALARRPLVRKMLAREELARKAQTFAQTFVRQEAVGHCLAARSRKKFNNGVSANGGKIYQAP